jgi:hypothetical protein
MRGDQLDQFSLPVGAGLAEQVLNMRLDGGFGNADRLGHP